jgi:outer membrane protein
LGVCLLWTAAPSWASEALKVGIVDFNKCLQQSDKGVKAYKGLKEKNDRATKELEGKQEELKKLYEEFIRRRNVLSADARKEKENELMRKDEDLRNLTRKKEEEMRKDTDAVLQPLIGELHEVMKKLAKDEGYTLILEGKVGAVYYFASPVNDITDKVIKLLNEAKKEKKK